MNCHFYRVHERRLRWESWLLFQLDLRSGGWFHPFLYRSTQKEFVQTQAHQVERDQAPLRLGQLSTTPEAIVQSGTGKRWSTRGSCWSRSSCPCSWHRDITNSRYNFMMKIIDSQILINANQTELKNADRTTNYTRNDRKIEFNFR